MGRAAQGSARGLYFLARVRAEPAGDCRQCDRQGRRHGQRGGAARGAASRGAPALWPLRPQAVCGLCGKAGAITAGRRRKPRHGAVHLVWWLAPITPSARTFAGLEAARHRCRSEGARRSDERTSSAQRQLELALQQARFSVAHARRQYDAVDPANRLVAGELERRWNEALQAMHRIEGEIAAKRRGSRRPWARRSGSS